MSEFEIFSNHFWAPLARFGLVNKFWLLNAETLINSWITILVITIILFSAKISIKRNPNSTASFLILLFVRSFKDLITQSLKRFHFGYFCFISALFIYIFFSNIISIIPWVEEPTSDVNTALSLGIISFTYVQVASLKTKGLKGYIAEFFEPFVLLFPLNVVGELAKIISISFRLFGNIFGGSVISKLFSGATQGSIITETLAIVSGVNFIIIGFFVLFEGTIQAFVFAMLSLTYLALATTHNDIKEAA